MILNIFDDIVMKMIKIAFFDIDGTLMKKNDTAISYSTKETLLKLKEKGIKIVLATGRLPTMIPDMRGVEFDAYITFNGGYCYSKDITIHDLPLSKKDIKTLLSNSRSLDLPVVLASRDKCFITGHDPDLWFYADECFDVSAHGIKEDIFQAVVGCTHEGYEKVINGANDLRITDWGGITADITHSQTNKAKGVKKVLEHFGIDATDAIAFGDASNDIEMLKLTKTAVAMADACTELKEIATHICRSISDDGITLFFKEMGIID